MLFNAFLSKLFKIMKIYAWKVQFQLGKNQQYLQGERDVAKWTVEIREIIGLKALEINVWIFAVLGENRNYYDCSHASEENRSYAPFHIFSSRQYKCQIIKN